MLLPPYHSNIELVLEIYFRQNFCSSLYLFFFVVDLSYIEMNQPWVYMCSSSQYPLPPPSPPNTSRSFQCTRSKRLSHASNLGWRSVSPQIIYMFRCCSLETSHLRLLSQSPKDCSIHLCLFFCFAYRVIIMVHIHHGILLSH